jgi:hypothetical protein
MIIIIVIVIVTTIIVILLLIIYYHNKGFCSYYFALDRTVSSLTSTYESSVSSVKGWSFFTDKDHWTNGYWEQKITALQNLNQKDFNIDQINEQGWG